MTQVIRIQMGFHPVTNYPLLEGNNYRTWSATMKQLLEAQGLYNHVLSELDTLLLNLN